MIRSCDAMGADLLIITGHAVDLYEPDVVVAAMGSFFNLPVVRIEDNQKLYQYIESLKARHPDFMVVGMTAHKENPVYRTNLSGPVLLMMGNETLGLNKAFKECCDVLCTIPMSERSYASSFNVSCAGAILMYEIVRQRGRRTCDLVKVQPRTLHLVQCLALLFPIPNQPRITFLSIPGGRKASPLSAGKLPYPGWYQNLCEPSICPASLHTTAGNR